MNSGNIHQTTIGTPNKSQSRTSRETIEATETPQNTHPTRITSPFIFEPPERIQIAHSSLNTCPRKIDAVRSATWRHYGPFIRVRREKLARFVRPDFKYFINQNCIGERGTRAAGELNPLNYSWWFSRVRGRRDFSLKGPHVWNSS